MPSTAKRSAATPRRDKWHEIEGRIFGRCMWQQVSKNRRCIMEGLMHNASGRIMIVEKTYNDPIPRGSERPWPELGGVIVYDQVSPEITAWDEYEKALASIA